MIRAVVALALIVQFGSDAKSGVIAVTCQLQAGCDSLRKVHIMRN